MLLEFRTRNYKSFADEMVFSMTPAPKQKGLDYSVLTQKAGSKDYKGLCSAVIYGPNASGKTNVIGAMDTFKSIVLRGNINNADAVSLNVAASSLELVPNCNGSAAPTEFGIRFVDNGLLVDYSIIIDLGTFLDKDYPRRIREEQLTVNGKQVFLRNETLEVQLPSVIKDYVNKSIKKKTAKMLDLAKDGLTDTELFLNNGFKSIYAQKLTASETDGGHPGLVCESIHCGLPCGGHADCPEVCRSESKHYLCRKNSDGRCPRLWHYGECSGLQAEQR